MAFAYWWIICPDIYNDVAQIFTMMLRIICAAVYNDVAHSLFDLETPANVQAANWSHVGGRPNGLQLLSHDTMWDVAHKWRSPERSAALMFSMSPIITPD